MASSVDVSSSSSILFGGSLLDMPVSASNPTANVSGFVADTVQEGNEESDDSLDIAMAAVSEDLEALVGDGSPPAPSPPRIIFQRYRLGPVDPQPDVSETRLVLFRYLKCLFVAAPAAVGSPCRLLDDAWSEYLVNFDEELFFAKVSQALDYIVPVVNKRANRPVIPHPEDRVRGQVSMSRIEKRRQEYAEMQKLFRKSPKRAVEKIISPAAPSSFPAPSHFEAFWRNAMSLPPGADGSPG